MLPALFIIFVSFLPANHAAGHHGSVIFPLYQLPPDQLPNIHDGSIEEWRSLLSEPTLTEADFIPAGTETTASGHNAEDLQVEVYLGWTPSPPRVYAAMERYDDVHVVADRERSTRSDGIYLNIDADHSGGRYSWGLPGGDCALSVAEAIQRGLTLECIPHIFHSYTHAQEYVVSLSTRDRGPTLFLPIAQTEEEGFTKDWAEDAPYAAVGGIGGIVRENLNYSVLEFFVTPFDSLDIRGPEFSLPSELREGQVMGLEVTMMDFDEPNVSSYSEIQSTLSGSNHVWFDADYFVDFRLLGSPPSPASTSVERTTWGDVKNRHRQVPAK